MSDRRYYEDAYTSRFQARIIETVAEENRQGLVLNETYFYPASGGQPADWGAINGRSVIDVTIREADGAVVHWLDHGLAEPGGEEEEMATAVLDWPRRFDHMQHHTGQHILSQAFIRAAGAETLSFHLSENSVTIDLDRSDLTAADISAAELLANQIVWENRPVTSYDVSFAEAAELPLRKIPPAQNGRLRLIDITNFDLTACGGTHVSHTGSVGLIKVLKHERRGEKTRIEFCCGGRALPDYGEKHTIVSALSAALTTGSAQLVAAVAKLVEDNKTAQRTFKKLNETLLTYQAEELLANATHMHGLNLIAHTYADADDTDLRALAAQVSSRPQVVALFGRGGAQAQLIFSRSADAPGDMHQCLQAALAYLGAGRGGGSAKFAQGGGSAHTAAQVDAAIAAAYTQLVESLT
ncbi:MAG: alanyl-tRNA editing protein [Chloroflexota bacterium]